MARPPLPLDDLVDRVQYVTWPAGRVIHRIHPDKYGAEQFNASDAGNARFSPIRTPEDAIIPTIYGGTDLECAAMETIFHDTPRTTTLKTLDKNNFSSLVYSQIACDCDLNLINLGSIALHAFGLERRDIIDTPRVDYPYSRMWAEAFHKQCSSAHGLYWQSRQADHAQAIVLFGDRLPSSSLKPLGAHSSVISPPTYTKILQLAIVIKVSIT